MESGIVPELLLDGQYGHQLHVWDLRTRKHKQVIDLGAEQQMALELRPAHDPRKAYGFVGVVTSLKDLSGAVFVWHQEGDKWTATKVIEVPAEPAEPELLPPLLKGFGAVPPVITDINLSLDDKYLYVSCWGTGEFRQYDVSDPFDAKLTGSVHLGGIVRKAAHPNGTPLNGGPQMVEVSRDGRRIYLTNSLYVAWDDQLYPEGLRGWTTKINASPGRWDRGRPGLLHGLRRRASTPDQAGRRRLLFRLVLLPRLIPFVAGRYVSPCSQLVNTSKQSPSPLRESRWGDTGVIGSETYPCRPPLNDWDAHRWK